MLNKIDELARELDTNSIDELVEKLNKMDNAVGTTLLHQELNGVMKKALKKKLKNLIQEAAARVGGIY